MKIIIVGNGILGLTTAYRLLKKNPSLQISIIGPSDFKGCASLAAAAMFNSFAEIDVGTLRNKIEREKFAFNARSTPLWPTFLRDLSQESGIKVNAGFGTYVINNHASDTLEDENFDAILEGLREYEALHTIVSPDKIPQYNPSVNLRAARAVYINNEGWVNPNHLFLALETILKRSSQVNFIDDYGMRLQRENKTVTSVTLRNGERIQGDVFFLAPGATFSQIIEASNLSLEFPRIFFGVGTSILLKTGADTLSHCIRTPNRGLACGVYSAPHDTAHTLIGASNFISPTGEDFGRATSVYSLLKAAMEQINVDYYRSGVAKVNVGWRPTSEDTIPLLGATSLSNLFVATGTKRDGLHCSPIISDCMAALIVGDDPGVDLSLFKPERSPMRIYSREEAIATTVRHTMNAAYQHDFTPAKNRMTEHLEKFYRDDLEKLHDKVGAIDWGIPPEMVDMYRYGHAQLPR